MLSNALWWQTHTVLPVLFDTLNPPAAPTEHSLLQSPVAPTSPSNTGTGAGAGGGALGSTATPGSGMPIAPLASSTSGGASATAAPTSSAAAAAAASASAPMLLPSTTGAGVVVTAGTAGANTDVPSAVLATSDVAPSAAAAPAPAQAPGGSTALTATASELVDFRLPAAAVPPVPPSRNRPRERWMVEARNWRRDMSMGTPATAGPPAGVGGGDLAPVTHQFRRDINNVQVMRVL